MPEIIEKKPFFLFAAALGSSKRAFHPLIENLGLTENDYFVVSYAGFRDRPLERPEGDPLAFAARELVDCVLTHPDEEIILVGHSMGGPVILLAYDILRKMGHTDRVTIVCIEGNMTSQDGGLISRRLAAVKTPEKAAELKHVIIEDIVKKSPFLSFSEVWFEDLKPIDPEVLVVYAQSLVRHTDTNDKLLDIFNSIPAGRRFYIHGDGYTKGNNSSLLPKLAEDSCLYIPGAGHFAMYDRPAETAEIIYSALSSKSGAHIVSEYFDDAKNFMDGLNTQIEQEKENIESTMRMRP